jgi:hypothetical protein
VPCVPNRINGYTITTTFVIQWNNFFNLTRSLYRMVVSVHHTSHKLLCFG